jgi:hypothetical protein
MKPITTSELRLDLDKYLTQAQKEEVLIALDGGQLVKLSKVEREDLSDEDLENDPRFAQIINSRRANYKQNGGIPFEVVQRTLIEELIEDLNHPDPQVRFEAIQHLVALGEAVIPALREANLKSNDAQSS